MKNVPEKPKIRLKIRQIDSADASNFEDDDTRAENSFVQQSPQSPKKIYIHDQIKEDENKKENVEKDGKKRSFFQISAIILTVLLVIAIVVEIAVMIWLKTGTENLKNQNDNLPKDIISISREI